MPFMIRDTFDANPGLQELFKRKMLERAREVGLNKSHIDFESQIDLKGTYHDNLRNFYRKYPQLSQDSDYFRIKSVRSLNGAALEQSWRSYERDNGPQTQGPTEHSIMPELVVTYTIGGAVARREDPDEPGRSPIEPTLEPHAKPASSHYGELVKLVLDRVTALAGEKVAKKILHQVGQEIGRTAFSNSRGQMLTSNLLDALDHALRVRGWGRVIDLQKTDRGSSVTYVCTIEGCPVCQSRVSTGATCDVTRGIVSRWLESHVQRKAENIESSCVAAASHLCVFQVTFKK